MSGSEILSQSEIDDLLSALSTGTVSAEDIKSENRQRKIKIYDFKRPDKFSKDQIRTLYMLHENFARLLNTYLSAHLRTIVHVNVVSVDQLTYEEFIRSVPNPSVISILQMQPLKGNAIFEINPSIVFAIIDRLLGGVGSSTTKSRPLTDIEEAIIHKVLDRALENFQEAWKQVIKIQPRLETIETNPQFTQIVPPSDMVVIITLQAKVMHAEGLINICIPYLVLEPIMSKLTTTFWVASSGTKQVSTETIDLLQKKIERAYIPIKVELGNVSINIQELLSLSVGDVLQLETKHSQSLDLIIGQNPKFKCKPGLSGSRMAVQITDLIMEGADDND